jgi:hypothetical protein
MGMRSLYFSTQRDNPDELGREPRNETVFHKIVRRRDGADTVDFAQGKEAHEDKGIEMAVVVGDDDAGFITAEMFASPHMHSEDQQYHRTDDEGEKEPF